MSCLPSNVVLVQINKAKILLTGATGGLGQAIASELHTMGGRLILTGRRRTVLDQLAAELPDSVVEVADLSDPKEIVRLGQKYADVDILVANAALPASGELTDFTAEQVNRALTVNFYAPIMLTHALLPQMVKRGYGHIVLIDSQAGKFASHQASLYNATKFGLRGFGLALHQDLAIKNVGVSVICPGFIREAGMFADANVQLPLGVGTSSPAEVADGVITAITHNKMEVSVAPYFVRIVSSLAAVAPALVSKFTRRTGAKTASKVAAGQSRKR